jgi:hypothetical protein
MGKNPDPGSGINIPDPQHCWKLRRVKLRSMETKEKGNKKEGNLEGLKLRRLRTKQDGNY